MYIVIAIVVVVVGAAFLYRRRKAKSAAIPPANPGNVSQEVMDKREAARDAKVSPTKL